MSLCCDKCMSHRLQFKFLGVKSCVMGLVSQLTLVTSNQMSCLIPMQYNIAFLLIYKSRFSKIFLNNLLDIPDSCSSIWQGWLYFFFFLKLTSPLPFNTESNFCSYLCCQLSHQHKRFATSELHQEPSPMQIVLLISIVQWCWQGIPSLLWCLHPLPHVHFNYQICHDLPLS